ncbi:hypothetical protein FACS189426_10780 [Bacteroidia bacterium]|nr:hypothetical protein FACS189426_10780 [Bacteroidia bacterium]GHT85126.1 hypothetical protein FACS18947_3500 [Bacteroidia bacterium]
MRKIGNIKLNQFSKNELDQRKMNALKGGCSCEDFCTCACYVNEFTGYVVSISYDNANGNAAYAY